MILLFAVLFIGTLTSGNILSLVSNHDAGSFPAWWHWPLALAVIGAAAATAVYRHCHPTARVIGATLVWITMLLFARSPLQIRSEALLLLAVCATAALWIAWTPKEERTESRLPYQAWFWTVYCMTFLWHHKPATYFHGADSPWGVKGLAWGLFAFALGSAASGRF